MREIDRQIDGLTDRQTEHWRNAETVREMERLGRGVEMKGASTCEAQKSVCTVFVLCSGGRGLPVRLAW